MNARLSESDVRLTAKRVAEDGHKIAAHFEFERNGGKLYWIVDTDVVKLFLNPRDNHRYADIFGQSGRSTSRNPAAERVALAALLADFIFAQRFHCSPVRKADRNHAAEIKLLLAPHVHEFQEVLAAVGRDALRDANRAVHAIGGKQLPHEIERLIDEYQKTKGQSAEDFVAKVQKLISDNLNLILPFGSLEELKRAQDLLKRRKALVYEADCGWMNDLFASDEAKRIIDELADKWRSEILTEAEREAEQRADRDAGKSSRERIQPVRSGDLDLRNHRDARVLAQLEYLDSVSTDGKDGARRFVFVTGHGLLHLVAMKGNRGRIGRSGKLHLLHPRAFLGSPDLFPIPGEKQQPLDSDHWIRLTRALTLLEKKARATTPLDDTEDAGYGETENQELVDRIQSEWLRLTKFALPFVTEQSREKAIRDILVALLRGESLDALEQALYLALSELFVLLAELGLAPRHTRGVSMPRRKPPPLRLAYYPDAETCIQALISDFPAAHEGSGPDIGKLIADVKTEQAGSGIQDFNYPLLICLAERFASLDDWHAARIIANYAASVAKVTANVAPLVTGREAALLESHCRRIEARTMHDLDRAAEALREYHNAVKREIDWRKNHPTVVERLPSFNPHAEFPLHLLRGKSEELTLELTRLMFTLFGETKDFVSILKSIHMEANRVRALYEEAVSLDCELAAQYPANGARPPMVSLILDFIGLQIAICAAQCAILLKAIDSSEAVATEGPSSEVVKRLRENTTAVTTMLVLVVDSLWETGEVRTLANRALGDLFCGEALMLHDSARCNFFKELAQWKWTR